MTYLPEARRQLLGAAERRAARRLVIRPVRLSWVAPMLSLAAAAAVAIAFLGVRAANHSHPAAPARSRQLQLVYQVQPTPQVPTVTRAALNLTVRAMNLRLSEIPHSRSSTRVLAGNRIRVDVFTRASRMRVEDLVGWTARLLFYDWEANVLLPNGRTAASEPRADVELSQGSGTVAPGSPGAGALGLYRAVKLASRQPLAPGRDNARFGSEYYLFARDGHSLLAGPLDPGQVSRGEAVRELEVGLTRSKRRDGRVLMVKQGTVVMQAAPNSFTVGERFGAPGASYYVLRDHVALFGNDISNPRAGIDRSGVPDVNFGFRGNGANAFQRLTATVARRGELVSAGSRQLFQHFAIALDNRLIIVSQIDYTQYPDGLTGSQDANVTAGFTRSAARGLATALRLGALPVHLSLLSAR